jgi:hypothetical protein
MISPSGSSGMGSDDANFVKALDKPSVSAWAVNQLRWNHSEAFEQLLAADRRFRQAQTSPTAGHTATKIADMRETRSEALSHLTELANSLLRDAGHNPTPDTMLRISTTLEAVSARASLSDSPTAGRLTRDVSPPGFESLASLMAGADAKANEEPKRATPLPKSRTPATPTRQQSSPSDDAEECVSSRNASDKNAAAKVSLQDAEVTDRSDSQGRSVETRRTPMQTPGRPRRNCAIEGALQKCERRFSDAADRLQSVAADAEKRQRRRGRCRRNVEKASQARSLL